MILPTLAFFFTNKILKNVQDLQTLCTFDLLFSGLNDAETCPEKEKVQITQMYLCNANKMK